LTFQVAIRIGAPTLPAVSGAVNSWPPACPDGPRGCRAQDVIGRLLLGAVLAALVGDPRPVAAKSPYYELLQRCPCVGPVPRTFWVNQAERLACIDTALEALGAEGWPEDILVRSRRREGKSRCGDTRFQCDGTPARPCPRGTVCEIEDPRCSPAGGAGVCHPPRYLRLQHGCRNEPRACDCEGRTHPSPCALWRKGEVLAHRRACARGCGGPDHLGCGEGESCFAPNCSDLGEWGSCEPWGCSYPGEVCGCDGVTYPTACAAQDAGVQIRSYLPCS
jgi:hypothetical protein